MTNNIFDDSAVTHYAKDKLVSPNIVAGVEDVHCGLSTDRYALQKDFIRGRLRGDDLLTGDRKDLLHRPTPTSAARLQMI